MNDRSNWAYRLRILISIKITSTFFKNILLIFLNGRIIFGACINLLGLPIKNKKLCSKAYKKSRLATSDSK